MLGPTSYGKAEVRLVHVRREPEGGASGSHELTDLNVSVALAGDLADTHIRGDNAKVLPTDTQKNTVYAFAREFGVGPIEEFGLRLARHFVTSQPSIHRARVGIEEYAWRRLGPHSFVRSGEGVRTAVVSCDARQAWVVSGVTGLVLLNTTGSEFHGFIRDRYTTLADAYDRILATAVTASWRHRTAEGDWETSYVECREALVGAFTQTPSRSLQQTLHAMGHALLRRRPEVVEVRLSLPNRHHFLVDLTPFELDNPNEVFLAADRPYGLIEGTVLGADPPSAGLAWSLHP